MAAPDEAEAQLIGALQLWDFSSIFPVGYTGTKAPMLVTDWPFDLIDNMQSENDGVMTQPIVSIITAMNDDKVRTFADHTFGSGTGTVAMGVDLSFILSCFADERMGAGPLVKKLMGQVQGCVLANRNSFTAFRHLLCSGGHSVYEERPQMWRADLTVSGDGINSV
jgi:hypothetical protein